MSALGFNVNDDDARLEAAAAWRLRVEEDESVTSSAEFQTWFAERANQDAYARVSSTWAVFDDFTAAPEIIAIRRDALHRARAASRHWILSRRQILGTLAASLLVVAMAGIGTWQYMFGSVEFVTGIGERRGVTLNDGSRLSLDSNTAVRVEYSKALRRLVLERGRARFDVAHDVNRPFTVTAGSDTVVAVGTSFNVERLQAKVLVTLIEGRVVVKSSPPPATTRANEAPSPKPTSLIAGQELVMKENARPVIRPADLPVVTAWETGRLVFNNEPLCEAIERVNRYTNRAVTVEPEVANLRISGVFNAGDVGAFIDAVTSYFPVTASTSADNHVILLKRS